MTRSPEIAPIHSSTRPAAAQHGLAAVARRTLIALVAGLLGLAPLVAQEATPPPTAGTTWVAPVTARHGMVAAQEARAARIGVEFLQRGGNAVDAAVATAFALAVTYPRAGNIGGGGYMVIHLADRNFADCDRLSRDRAGRDHARRSSSTRRARPTRRKSRDSALAIGVPGTVAGLALAHAKYGSGNFTLAELLAPAIRLAREGLPIDYDIAELAAAVKGAACSAGRRAPRFSSVPTGSCSPPARRWCRATSPRR